MEPRKYGPFEFSSIARRSPLKWPNGVRLALWIIPNVEIFHLDSPMPGDANERPTGRTPMVRQWAQRDFGNRVGIWRVMEILSRHNVRATVALNSDVCVHLPVIVEECIKLNWELMGHGRTNLQRVTEVPPEAEAPLIKDVFDTIEAAAGKRPVGWLSSGLDETWNTLDHLIDNGCRYVSDWVNDEQPYLMDVSGRQLVNVPYSFELNDSAVLWRYRKTVPEFERMIKDAFEVLYRESETSGRVMALSLHPYIIGQASAIGLLDRVLQHILAHDGVWAATGTEIMEAYLSQLADN